MIDKCPVTRCVVDPGTCHEWRRVILQQLLIQKCLLLHDATATPICVKTTIITTAIIIIIIIMMIMSLLNPLEIKIKYL